MELVNATKIILFKLCENFNGNINYILGLELHVYLCMFFDILLCKSVQIYVLCMCFQCSVLCMCN
jgi:hypothetical protein